MTNLENKKSPSSIMIEGDVNIKGARRTVMNKWIAKVKFITNATTSQADVLNEKYPEVSFLTVKNKYPLILLQNKQNLKLSKTLLERKNFILGSSNIIVQALVPQWAIEQVSKIN